MTSLELTYHKVSGGIMKFNIVVRIAVILITCSSASYACDKASALQVDSMLSQKGTKKVSGNTVTFRWGNDWNSMSRTEKDQMIHIVADSDACIKGYAREIIFYSPKGKKVGVASPDIGIKLY
jgi:hypothetical protein